MPITLSYDLRNAEPNQRTYLRSMLERFGWRRLGGSTFRYPAGNEEEDWLNDVIPSLMFFRSYLIRHQIFLRFFTLDTHSVIHLDHSDEENLVGDLPMVGEHLELRPPTNPQSSERLIRRFVDTGVGVIE
jgi:hypothetical protein